MDSVDHPSNRLKTYESWLWTLKFLTHRLDRIQDSLTLGSGQYRGRKIDGDNIHGPFQAGLPKERSERMLGVAVCRFVVPGSSQPYAHCKQC